MESEYNDIIVNEALVVSDYLIKEPPHEKEIELYKQANRKLNIILYSSFEKKLWAVMLNNKKMFGVYDAGLALVKPESLIRRKILVMLAILEASPRHCHKFLPVAFKKTRLFLIGVKAFLSIIKSVIGFVIVKAYSILWR